MWPTVNKNLVFKEINPKQILYSFWKNVGDITRSALWELVFYSYQAHQYGNIAAVQRTLVLGLFPKMSKYEREIHQKDIRSYPAP